MHNRMKTIVTATLIIIGGGLYLSHPPAAAASACSEESAISICRGTLNLLCGAEAPGECTLTCVGGNWTGIVATCG